MRRFAAFLTRLVVFGCLVWVQRAIVLGNPVLHDLDTRILISSLQVFLVGCILWLYFTCKWMFEIMHVTGPYSNVHLAVDETQSMHGEAASQVSQGLVAQQVVIFVDRGALSHHVMRVYVVGFMLYATVFCFNYTTTAIFFHTSTGVVLGFLIRNLHFTRLTTLVVLFACMFACVLVLTYIDLAARGCILHRFQDVLTGVVVPIVVGCAWVSGLCFGENNRHCVEMATEAFPVCCLCVVPVMWATPFERWDHTFSEFDAGSFVLVLLVEPILKFMSIYVLMISLQTQNVLDIVLVMCSTAQGELLLDEVSPYEVNWLATTRLIIVAIVLVMRTLQYCYIDAINLCNPPHGLSSPSNSCADEYGSPHAPDAYPHQDPDLSLHQAVV